MAGHSRAGWDCELFGADPPRLASAERSVADEGRLLGGITAHGSRKNGSRNVSRPLWPLP